jgi:D-aminopeptidase
MRVLLVCDMEGIAGIEGWHHCSPRSDQWRTTGRRLLAAQVRAAVEGLLSSFDEVVVVDAHWASTNLPDALFADLPVTVVHGDLYDMTMTPYLGSVDALAMVGLHAGATYKPGNILAHTIEGNVVSLEWEGRIIGETGLNLLAAAYSGVPTIFVHGDVVACLEARNLVGGNLPCVATKSPKAGRYSAGAWCDLHSPEDAATLTRETCVVAGHLFSSGVRLFPPMPSDVLSLKVNLRNGTSKIVSGTDGLTVYQDLLDALSGRRPDRQVRAAWHEDLGQTPSRHL